MSDTRNVYCDAVLPKHGEYRKTKVILRIPHKTVSQKFTLIKKRSQVKLGDHISWDQKFFSGPIVKDLGDKWMVKNTISGRCRTIPKDQATPCMHDNEFYRNKETGEWFYNDKVTKVIYYAY